MIDHLIACLVVGGVVILFRGMTRAVRRLSASAYQALVRAAPAPVDAGGDDDRFANFLLNSELPDVAAIHLPSDVREVIRLYSLRIAEVTGERTRPVSPTLLIWMRWGRILVPFIVFVSLALVPAIQEVWSGKSAGVAITVSGLIASLIVGLFWPFLDQERVLSKGFRFSQSTPHRAIPLFHRLFLKTTLEDKHAELRRLLIYGLGLAYWSSGTPVDLEFLGQEIERLAERVRSARSSAAEGKISATECDAAIKILNRRYQWLLNALPGWRDEQRNKHVPFVALT